MYVLLALGLHYIALQYEVTVTFIQTEEKGF